MKKHLIFFILAALSVLGCGRQTATDYTDFVDPKIGSGGGMDMYSSGRTCLSEWCRSALPASIRSGTGHQATMTVIPR